MHYLVAVLIPPQAVLLCGKPFQADINLIIWPLTPAPGTPSSTPSSWYTTTTPISARNASSAR